MKIHDSNNERANSLWRIMLERVPICTVLWAGTITVSVFCESSSERTIFRSFMWLPFWETKVKPLVSNIARTLAPESDFNAGTKRPTPTELHGRPEKGAAQFPPELHLRETIRAPPANLSAPHLRLCPAKRCPIRDKVPSSQIDRWAQCRVELKGKVSWQIWRSSPHTRGTKQ